MNQTTAVNTPNLSQSSINDTLNQVVGIGGMGGFIVHSGVPSPVTAKDISDAVKYILDSGITSKFGRHVKEVSHTVASDINARYEIPLEGRAKDDRSAPCLVFELHSSPLYSSYSSYWGRFSYLQNGEHYLFASFSRIPIAEEAAKDTSL